MLIRRHIIERHGWVSVREFNEDWALSQLSPGIHLIALAGLLGRRIAGWRGVFVSVAAMMVPAAIVTVAMTAAFGAVADHPLARAAVAGMAPATGGMTIALAALLVRDTKRRGRHGLVDVLVAIAALGFLQLTSASSIVVIVAGAIFGALFLGRERPTSERATSE
jgi:chromate transport protein ChrA